MDTTLAIVIVALVAVAIVAIVAVLAVWQRRKRRHRRELQATFGTEYDRTIARAENRSSAEQALDERKQRVENYQLRDLDPEEQRRYAERWRVAQSDFVDNPSGAVTRADDLLAEVMRARGYGSTSSGISERAADISVGHGDDAEAYREARSVAARNRNGEATTEDLRQAMHRYRQVFESLLVAKPATARR